MDATPIHTVSGIASGEASDRSGLGSGKAVTGQLPAGSLVEDAVELSPAGIALSRAGVQSPPRLARISEIRAAIKAGTFETPERIDGTIERLLEMLGWRLRVPAREGTVPKCNQFAVKCGLP